MIRLVSMMLLFAAVACSKQQPDTPAIGVPAELTMSVQENLYQFTYNGKTVTMPRHCTGSSIQGYRLYPYFGGDETAPHDIYVYIKEL